MNSRAVGMDRHTAAKRVMKSIAVGPKKVDLPFTAEDGSKPLVVTTPGEYLSVMIERVRAAGGSANVALAEARGFTVFAVIGLPSGPGAGAETKDVNEDMSVGMFWLRHKARKKRDAKISYRLTAGDAVVTSPAQEFSYA